LGGIVATVESSYATGNVTAPVNPADGTLNMGGLIGLATRTLVKDSYATGDVMGNRQTGGLIGNSGGRGMIVNSWASGNVNGLASVGGLVGANSGTIESSYATGSVHGRATETSAAQRSLSVGGLVGFNGGSVNGINNSWFSGKISSASESTVGLGGLVGWMREGYITNSYYNATLNAGLNSIGDTNQMGSLLQPPISVDGRSGGLTEQQFTDLTYYLDGTIEQVLADSAEAELRVRIVAASQQASTAAQTAQQQIATTGTVFLMNTPSANSLASLSTQLSFTNVRFPSADIERLNADGVTYDIDPKQQ